MMLEISRITIFARDLRTPGTFYGEVFGFPETPSEETGWREFETGPAGTHCTRAAVAKFRPVRRRSFSGAVT